MRTKLVILSLLIFSYTSLFAEDTQPEDNNQRTTLIPLAVGNEWHYKRNYDFDKDADGQKIPLIPKNSFIDEKIIRMEKLEDIVKGKDSTEFYVTIDSLIPDSKRKILFGYAKANNSVIYMKIYWKHSNSYKSEPLRFFPDIPSSKDYDKNDPEKFRWLDDMKQITIPSGTYNCYQLINNEVAEYYAPGIGFIAREDVFILGTRKQTIVLIDYKLAQTEEK